MEPLSGLVIQGVESSIGIVFCFLAGSQFGAFQLRLPTVEKRQMDGVFDPLDLPFIYFLPADQRGQYLQPWNLYSFRLVRPLLVEYVNPYSICYHRVLHYHQKRLNSPLEISKSKQNYFTWFFTIMTH